LRDKYLFIFVLSVFFILSICGAGIFINDEWMVAQELNQLSQGHQILHNEGKYGYYSNGSIGNYMDQRSNVLIYSATLPLLSLPLSILFTYLSTEFTRLFIIFIWSLLGLYIIYYIKSFIKHDGIYFTLVFLFSSLIVINLILAICLPNNFVMSGKFVPYEIIPIVCTNILLFGIFSVLCYKVSELLFQENFKQIIGWLSAISLSSIMFWSTTLKDHLLLSCIIMLICYIQLSIHNNYNYKYNIIKYMLSGLTIWIRPEVGLFVCICILCYDIYYNKLGFISITNTILYMFIGSLPFFINNFISTNNPFEYPFLLSYSNQTGGTIIDQITRPTSQLPIIHLFTSNPVEWIKLIFTPSSGALGLIVPLCLFFFSILVYIKHRPRLNANSKFLLALGISTITYYVLYAGINLGIDNGVIPDIRYFTPSYALFTLFALSILPYNLNYRKMFKNVSIYIPIIIIISLFAISIYSPIGETFKTFRMVPHIISTISLAIMLIILVNDGNSKPTLLENIIPLAIASAFTWQVIIIFVYHISKAHYYPMFIPITEIIYKLLFGV
jgi:hypothetical protein